MKIQTKFLKPRFPRMKHMDEYLVLGGGSVLADNSLRGDNIEISSNQLI